MYFVWILNILYNDILLNSVNVPDMRVQTSLYEGKHDCVLNLEPWFYQLAFEQMDPDSIYLVINTYDKK